MDFPGSRSLTPPPAGDSPDRCARTGATRTHRADRCDHGPRDQAPPDDDGTARERRSGRHGARAGGRRGFRARSAQRGFGATLGWTALGAVLPGSAFLAAGRRRLGAVTLLVFALVVGGLIWLATAGRRTAVRLAVDTEWLLWTAVAVGIGTLLWAVVIVAGYRMLAAPGTSRGRHVLGSLVVLLLVAAVALPAVAFGQVALAQRGLVGERVRRGPRVGHRRRDPGPLRDQGAGERPPARRRRRRGPGRRPHRHRHRGQHRHRDGRDDALQPAAQPRGPALPGRQSAGRGLPRRLRRRLRESESLLNAVYRNGPAEHPDVLGPHRRPGRGLPQARRRRGPRARPRLLRPGQPRRVQPPGRRPRRHHRERQLLRARSAASPTPGRCPTTTSRRARTSTWTAPGRSTSPAAGSA